MKRTKSFRLKPVTAAVLVATTALASQLAHAGPGWIPTGTAGGYTSVDPNVVPNNGLGVWNASASRPTFYANSPAGLRTDPITGALVDTGTPLRKFVDTLPGLTPAAANNLGQYLPVAVADTTSYPGADYYEMAVVEYAEKVHSDLPKATTFRGYVQIDRAMTNSSGGASPAVVLAYNNYVAALAAWNAANTAYQNYLAALATWNTLDLAYQSYVYNTALYYYNNYQTLLATYNTQLAAYTAANLGLTAAQTSPSWSAYMTYLGYANGLAAAQAAFTPQWQNAQNLPAAQTAYQGQVTAYSQAVAAAAAASAGAVAANGAYATYNATVLANASGQATFTTQSNAYNSAVAGQANANSLLMSCSILQTAIPGYNCATGLNGYTTGLSYSYTDVTTTPGTAKTVAYGILAPGATSLVSGISNTTAYPIVDLPVNPGTAFTPAPLPVVTAPTYTYSWIDAGTGATSTLAPATTAYTLATAANGTVSVVVPAVPAAAPSLPAGSPYTATVSATGLVTLALTTPLTVPAGYTNTNGILSVTTVVAQPAVPTYTYTDPSLAAPNNVVTTAYGVNATTGALILPVNPGTTAPAPVANPGTPPAGVIADGTKLPAVVANPGPAPAVVANPGPAPAAVAPPTGVGTPSAGSKAVALYYPNGTPIMVALEDAGHNIVKDATGNPVMVQAYAYDNPHYLGPVIVAQGESSPGLGDNRPLRMKFDNLLPTGRATTDPLTGKVTRNGDLFLPFDTTLIGGGATPVTGETYMQNRAAVHLHGGVTPWISDGTPHQWITPVGESPAVTLRRGVSDVNVPDMPDPGDGAQTLFWTNAQSARLMFWHDHTVAQTRLNVYAGMAAGYVITDKTESAFMTATGLGLGIPLVFEDKTFVPKDVNAGVGVPKGQDDKWRTDAWGQYGDLWYPHVVEPNQDPNSMATQFGNPVGRWDYALWFWPVFPVTNALPTGDYGNVTTTPEAFNDTPTVNGTAYPTMTVNPEPTRFRILNAANDRFLNLQLYVADPAVKTADGRVNTEVKMIAANNTGPGNVVLPDCRISADGYDQLVLPLTPVAAPPAGAPLTGTGSCYPVNWPSDGRVGGVPDPSAVGPTMWHIGSEGGFLPAVASEPPVPVNYDYNRRSVTVLNVSQNNDPTQACSLANGGNGNCHGLYVGPAERADVVVDFSAYAGKTLIVYNDAPSPNPGYDPRVDYFTGDPDNTLNGGAATTQPGYGPNMRTLMQIVVAPAATAKTNATAAAQTAFVASLNGALKTAYAASQEKPIVAESAYDKAFGTTAAPVGDQLARIFFGSTSQKSVVWNDGNGAAKTYCVPNVVAGTGTTFPSNMASLSLPANCNGPILNKAIQELFDKYGRMNATLGTELPATSAITQTTIPFGYIDPNTETLPAGETQIWKITHNGVDAHPVHFHLVNVQLINRVGWDGTLKAPENGELGWKETIKMNPLEDVIVAVRAKVPPLPGFGLPKSSRPLDPSQPIGGTTDFMNIDPNTGLAPAGGVSNQVQDFDWEYVWHCHILGHEENDFMRPFVYTGLSVAPTASKVDPLTQAYPATLLPGAPTAVTAINTGTLAAPSIALGWTDNSTNEVGFRVERAPGLNAASGFAAVGTLRSFGPDVATGFTPKVGALANATTFVDGTLGTPSTPVAPAVAAPAVAPTTTASLPAATSNVAFGIAGAPAYSATLTWSTSATASRYVVLRADVVNGVVGAYAALPATAGSVVVSGTTATFKDVSVLPDQTYAYQVQAVAANGEFTYRVVSVSATADAPSAGTNFSFNVPNATATSPNATTPALLVKTAAPAAQMLDVSNIQVSFTNLSWGETGYALQYATNTSTTNPNWAAVPATIVQSWSSMTPAPNALTTATLTWPIPGVPNNSRLRFRVAATHTNNGTGQIGPWSAASNMINLGNSPVMSGVPTVALCNPAAPGCRSVSWTAAPSASSYSAQYALLPTVPAGNPGVVKPTLAAPVGSATLSFTLPNPTGSGYIVPPRITLGGVPGGINCTAPTVTLTAGSISAIGNSTCSGISTTTRMNAWNAANITATTTFVPSWANATMATTPVLTGTTYTANVTGLPTTVGTQYEIRIQGTNVNGTAPGLPSAPVTAP